MKGSSKKKPFVHYLPIYGCITTGLIYTGIGVIAILSLLSLKRGGADEGSLIAFLNDFLAGKILIWIILLGTICYIVWRIYESIKDPYEYGTEVKGIATRTGIALSSVADGLIAYSAIRTLFGTGQSQENGQPVQEQEAVNEILQKSWGVWFVIGLGAVVAATAVMQFLYGVTKGYRERLDIAHYRSSLKKAIHVLAWAGYTSRGIILGLIGFFLIKAGVEEEARHVVNTDKAFDFIGDHVGHVYFVLVAAGTIFYGLFMFALGIAYDADDD